MSNISSFLYGQIVQSVPIPQTSFSGKTIIITGANTGLGYDTALHLIRLKVSHLILGCRSLQKGLDAKKTLGGDTASTKIDVWQIDLCSYASVLAFAGKCAELERLDGLLNNAGVMYDDFHLAEGNEATITVNVISTMLLSLLLLPTLRKSAAEYGTTPHIVIVGSMIHLFADGAQLTAPPKSGILDALNDESTARMHIQRYYLSKLMTMLLVRELGKRANANRNQKVQVVINGPNPGWCRTSLHRNAPLETGPKIGLALIGRTSEAGSRTLVHALTAGGESNGQYLSECVVKPPSGFVRSADGERVQLELWEEVMKKLEAISPGLSQLVDSEDREHHGV